ncbi:hypothetical protein PINS_up016049 [Pythium insidiosum]|nr:hypothetical protein PINS_up016049 [Pythium insidiosum]
MYEDHVQRKSQRDLPHVNVILLEHIVSSHPEVAVVECQTSQEAQSGGLTDAEVNAAMEKQRKRNHEVKLGMMRTLQRLSLAPSAETSSKPENTTQGKSIKKESLRIKSLAQVGPLLCVDRFEHKDELLQMRFAEQNELKMDRNYLEAELDIGVERGQTPSEANRASTSMSTIETQIRHAHKHAEEVLENKISLQRRTLAMYTNLQQLKQREIGTAARKTPSQRYDAMLLAKQTGLALADTTEVKKAEEQTLQELLKPSPFLEQHLPSECIRPHTAPNNNRKRLARVHSAILPTSKSSQNPGRLQTVADSVTERPLTASTSLAQLSRARSSGRKDLTLSTQSTDRSLKPDRRSTLDQLYIDHVQMQSPIHRSPSRHHMTASTDSDHGGPCSVTSSNEMTDETETSSLRKLNGINSIISMANACSGDGGKSGSNSFSRGLSTSDGNQWTLLESDETTIRAHLEQTQQRMALAMRDNERDGLSTRSLINRKRREVEKQKKNRRMEDYLQQKRRELNTNIGSVFKRTSFAIDTKPSDDSARSAALAARSQALAAVADASQDAHEQVEKSKVFGIYGVKEVMSVIRLFWSMDDDGSGHLTLAELRSCQAFFEKLGFHDMSTVFQAIDKDGDGQITLRELLQICFHYATGHQIDEMLKLAKMGNVRAYLQNSPIAKRQARDSRRGQASNRRPGSAGRTSQSSSSSIVTDLLPEHRAELQEIFSVFDKDGDGGVSLEEIIDVLHVVDEEDSDSIGNQNGRRGHAALTKADVQRLYSEFDANNNKTLDFAEFVALMQALYRPK